MYIRRSSGPQIEDQNDLNSVTMNWWCQLLEIISVIMFQFYYVKFRSVILIQAYLYFHSKLYEACYAWQVTFHYD